ncbi:SDR family oxidoreductase [Nocardiopsis sp. N85]|uniref:SDR family oxidoreductase n=1 Tax=Nocardiopsis sp. N85 TaxID=3029400 RepID=UPI00237FD3AE|nr:SDR family oxidoreductase [Nocardiopsis sp. N85]MDE3725247.1 SDR family oxidoreductase [Nocardiopsis sp. N85]
MTSRFGGRTAIVTGASRGIGLAIARRLVDEGARVCITARRPDPLQEAVEALGGPEHAIGVAGGGDDPEHQDAAIAATLEAFGGVDLFVNNTGINPVYGRMVDLDLDAARKIVEVNALSAISWVQKAYKAWMAEHGGAIVNVSSVAGIKPAPGIGFYGATKAMLTHITEELALELAPDVRVNGVAPAVVKTKFAAALYEGREEKVAAQYPLGRLGTPEDVAGAVAFLLSDDASWVTGRTLVLDGGTTLTGGV